jgi:putative two-component system response regulator
MSIEQRATLLIVDDEPINISVLMDLLKADYRLVAARNGDQALQRAMGDSPPDLILMDVMMPGMDGYEVCRRLKSEARTRDIPVIFVTAMSDEKDEQRGLALGAVDYVTKPISPPIVEARVRNHVALRQARQALAMQNQILEQRVAERTHELAVTQDITILALATLAETRDNETGNHIRRTQHYVRTLAMALRQKPEYVGELTDSVIDLLFKSAPLHDIGKVGIPDHVLLKPGRLSEEEWLIMRTHPALGRDAIVKAEALLGNRDSSFLRFAREIAYYHHEKWDGSGYPEGLAGSSIPLSGRLMAVADVYDALISRRVYKEPFSHEKAMEIIVDGRGRHFDPNIVDTFVDISDEFRAIAGRYTDDSHMVLPPSETDLLERR